MKHARKSGKSVKKADAGPSPVSNVVHSILAAAKSVHDAKPEMPTDRRAADMTSALSHAAKLLASMDAPAAPVKAPTPMQRVLASIGLASKAVKASRTAPTLAMSKDRIETVLKQTTTGAAMMSLDDIVNGEREAANEGTNCVLPEGARDPICEPR